MATGIAVLTQDVTLLKAAIATSLQNQASLITLVQTEQTQLAAAIAANDPAAIASASSNIETILSQLNDANTAAQTALATGQAPAAPVQSDPTPAPSDSAPSDPVVTDPASSTDAPVSTDPATTDTGDAPVEQPAAA